jgi:hypothetical protein
MWRKIRELRFFNCRILIQEISRIRRIACDNVLSVPR